MKLISLLILALSWAKCRSISTMMFLRTLNMTTSVFEANRKQLTRSSSVTECGQKCHYFEVFQGNYCNSFSYQEGVCELAFLPYLKQPGPAEVAKEIFVTSEAARNGDIICNGGEHCCNQDQGVACSEGEGDCNLDIDCNGLLICGKNNCLAMGKSGGLWDEDDDCCERRCTPDHPCKEGEGHCTNNNDCENPGWSKCSSGVCLNRNYFPLPKYFKNTEVHGYTSSDSCCHRVCNKDYNLCSVNQVGCKQDDDCQDGLVCETRVAQPYCRDLNECDGANGKFLGEVYCGSHAICVNSVGNFSCSCYDGFLDHLPYRGCRDKDECIEGGSNCGANSKCWNTPGSFVCTCKQGYEGDPIAGCTDINECSDPALNNCTASINKVSTDTFSGNKVKFFPIGNNPDGFSVKILFEAFGSGEANIVLCETSQLADCYRLEVGAESNTKMNLHKCTLSNPSKCDLKASFSHSNSFQLALSPDAKTFWFRVQFSSPLLEISAGLSNEPESVTFSDTNSLLSVRFVGVYTMGDFQATFWRNIRTSRLNQNCENTDGSFICIDEAEDLAAIGFGGSSYRSEFTVVNKNMMVCPDHNIPTLQARHEPGVAAVDNWLFVCGGKTEGGSSLRSCQKTNLDDVNPIWESAPNLPVASFMFATVVYEKSIYISGGYNDVVCFDQHRKFDTQANTWSSMELLPKVLRMHCSVADEKRGLIWILGGQSCSTTQAKVFMYNVSANTWEEHKDMPWSVGSPACSIVTQSSGADWLLVVGSGKEAAASSIAYYDITNSIGWVTASALHGNYYHYRMRMISLTPYSAMLVGGQSQRFGNSYRNIWEYNPGNYKFQDGFYFLTNQLYSSHWTRMKRSYLALQNCFSYIKYAAVGWGGHTTSGSVYSPVWEVLFRSRKLSGDTTYPAKCVKDTTSSPPGIPDLSPGKYGPGVVAVGYKLIVCGGHAYGQQRDNKCFWIDTNNITSTWSPMDSTLVERNEYSMVSYGEAVFAIGGITASGWTNQVDRWTESRGWETVSPYPLPNIGRHCAVADEGNDVIYSSGGQTCTPGCSVLRNVYKYKVSTDTWSSFTGIIWTRYRHQCGILRRRNDAHKMLVVIGHGEHVQMYDLTAMSGFIHVASMDTWWYRGSMVSLTPWESFLVGGEQGKYRHSINNWYLWNNENNRHEDVGLAMDEVHTHGQFTRIPEDAAMLKGCKLI